MTFVEVQPKTQKTKTKKQQQQKNQSIKFYDMKIRMLRAFSLIIFKSFESNAFRNLTKKIKIK